MARIASHLVCPYLFHHGPSTSKRAHGIKSDGSASMIFGRVFEFYIYKTLEERGLLVTHNQKVAAYNTIGEYDIATPDTVIEVKYSRRVPVKELIEIYKPQVVFYALALGVEKAMIIAGNPVEDKIIFHEINKDEIKKWAGYIMAVTNPENPYDKPRPTAYCDLCPIKHKCPAHKIKRPYDSNNKTKEST